MKVMTSQY